MKTREEEIRQAAIEYARKIKTNVFDFAEGVRWADEHPKNPWREASKELPKSADEVFIYAGGVTTIGRYIQDENIWRVPVFGVIEDAEYWMPMPSLPKGGEI